ncbi:MAG: hydroxyacid dehydrogenase [Anaerolineaceae bacterium]|nr:hydroxyacid dehydrogenase [Anaerolineaceae bacterium]
MADWKVMLTDGLEEKGQSILRESAEVANRKGISAEELLQEAGDLDAIIVRSRTKVTPEVFKAAKKLKVVGRAGVGVDNIDLDAARRAGVTVVNSPYATSVAVAELTLGLMLSLVREIPRADAAMKRGEWLKKDLMGKELYQKTLGLIGLGRIGSVVGKRAAAFEMQVLAYDPLVPADEIRSRGAEPVSLDTLLERSDIISLHVSLNETTRNLLNAETFNRMKSGVYLVCAARGGVIDEQALFEALESGKVAGAGLDVFAAEPPGPTPLVNHPRVIAAPHIGAQSIEAQERAAEDIATEVLAALRGDPLRWKVA